MCYFECKEYNVDSFSVFEVKRYNTRITSPGAYRLPKTIPSSRIKAVNSLVKLLFKKASVINAEYAAEITRGTWPTTTVPFNMATP